MTACYDHLLSKQPNPNNPEGEGISYYKKKDEFALERAKKHISNVLNEGLENEFITKEEHKAMDPSDKNPSKFYCNMKIHKAHETIPPVRPIISGSGSITENIGVYVEHHINQISTTHPSYLQDTPHFLRIVNKINNGPKLPSNSMLVTSDITGAYTNIPQDDGSECLLEALEERKDKKISSKFTVDLMELIQKYNIFEFHNGMLWKQVIGVAMGIHPAPSFANIYLARRIDKYISELGHKYRENGESAFVIFKRFLDDIFKIFKGTTKQLHSLFEDMNKIHPTLKFTMTHTTPEKESPEDNCGCEKNNSVPFLDTELSIENGKIEIDLHRKKTHSNQYLLPSSCHPKATSKAIPYSLALRIIRICTKKDLRDLRLKELKELLLAREYPENLIDRAITKAAKIPRKVALLKVRRKAEDQKRPVFVIKYDPRMPPIQNIQAKHWRAMAAQDQHLAEVFKQPPLIAYRRQRNLKDILIKSKVPPPIPRYPQREVRGMAKCGKACPSCPFISTGSEIKMNQGNTWKITKKFTCETFNCVYLISCNKCGKRYIGETGRLMKHRLAEHIGYINNQVSSVSTGEHFNLPGHSLANIKITILEQVKKNDILYRKEREKYLINKFNTYYQGLNREK